MKKVPKQAKRVLLFLAAVICIDIFRVGSTGIIGSLHLIASIVLTIGFFIRGEGALTTIKVFAGYRIILGSVNLLAEITSGPVWLTSFLDLGLRGVLCVSFAVILSASFQKEVFRWMSHRSHRIA